MLKNIIRNDRLTVAKDIFVSDVYKPSKYCKLLMCAVLATFVSAAGVFAQVPVPKSASVPEAKTDAYTYVKVDEPGDNTITKYEWSETEKKLVPAYYEIKITNKTYGEGSKTAYLNWDENKNLSFAETPSGSNYITLKFDENNLPVTSGIVVGESENIAEINDNFILNTNNSSALTNEGKIGNINGNFIGNYKTSTGAAIVNAGEIENINSNFIGNKVAGNTQNYAGAAAIYNEGVIQNITGSFIANSAENDSYRYNGGGGAIINNNIIGNITADFIGNYVDLANGYAYGGAILNSGLINNINGNFIGNYVKTEEYGNMGGAIYNDGGMIQTISGSFTKNSVESQENAAGGAIANSPYYGVSLSLDARDGNLDVSQIKTGISKINADFTENTVTSEGYEAKGGAIYNRDSIGEITGNFYKNSAVNIKSVKPIIASIETYSEAAILDFYGAKGGAIANESRIDRISGNFIENTAVSNLNALGGAIYSNTATDAMMIRFEDGNMISQISGMQNKPLNIENSSFINNAAVMSMDGQTARGGAIASIETYEGILFDVKYDDLREGLSNYGYDVNGLSNNELIDLYIKICNTNYGESYGIYTSAAYKGNVLNPKISNAYFEGNKAATISDDARSLALGGAIYSKMSGYAQTPTYGSISPAIVAPDISYIKDDVVSMEITNSSFINNVAQSEKGTAQGGAIYSEGNLTINADNGVSLFRGNRVIDKEKNDSNAIYMASTIYMPHYSTQGMANSEPVIKTAQLNLNARNNGVIQFDDKISGGAINPEYQQSAEEHSETQPYQERLIIITSPFIEIPETAYDLNINGDKTGKVIFNNEVINANIKLDNTNVYLGTESNFDKSQSLTLNSGMLSLVNKSIGRMNIPLFSLQGDTDIAVDVDLASKTMDRITASKYDINPEATLNVNHLNLLSDANQDKTYVLFAEEDLKNNVAYTGASPVAYSPIWKYDVDYLKETGEFLFSRGAGSSSNDFNPSVLPVPVATQAGAYATQMQTFNYAFQHADNFMMLPSLERTVMSNQNRYAVIPENNGVFSPLMTPGYSNNFWVKPYASFESIPLKNGPTVSNINYGTLIGYDTAIKSIGNGFERVLTGYVGYNGSSQRYQGIDTYQNGGLIGTTATFYKGNFFNASTISVGASSGSSSTMYGNENFAMLMAGVGNKTGYNFEFKDGLFILQPAMLLSYSFINTFDYTNAAGLRIESDPLHAIQLSPGIKFILNTQSGWQPYLAVDMVWNILDETRVKANDVRLPDMSIKPYVSYGLGVQKRFNNDRYTAFGQTMVHNGGRRGVSLTFGFRWKVGK